MASPNPMQQNRRGTPDAWQMLRSELGALADALVDARAADRPELRARVRHAVDTHRRCAPDQDDLARLLHHILSDLAGDAASLDTLYYARQLAVVADRLPN